jgi:hypothetical protein
MCRNQEGILETASETNIYKKIQKDINPAA